MTIFWPRMPPAALMSSTACSVPFLSWAPKAAFGPVIGPATPSLTSASAAPDQARPAASTRPVIHFFCIGLLLSIVRLFERRSLSRAPHPAWVEPRLRFSVASLSGREGTPPVIDANKNIPVIDPAGSVPFSSDRHAFRWAHSPTLPRRCHPLSCAIFGRMKHTPHHCAVRNDSHLTRKRPQTAFPSSDRGRTTVTMFENAATAYATTSDVRGQARSFQKKGPSATWSQRYLSIIWPTRVVRYPIAPMICTTIVSTT